MRRRLVESVLCALGIALWAVSAALPPAGHVSAQSAPRVGPAHGTLIVAGGGRLGPEIMSRFVALAGGPDARIVVIPTAGEQDSFPADWSGLQGLRAAGAQHITVLHTRDAKEADRASFAAPLRRATGVWIPGGRQWRLADAYLGTRTLRALFAVLDRGGVIGGSSAGASIQASYMVRGAVEGNQVMMAPGHEQGFGFLRGMAVDQHILTRSRQDDMLGVIKAHPQLLGVGLDEGTAIIVQGDTARVVGRSKAAFYNTSDAGARPYYFLKAGDAFDLGGRRSLEGEHIDPTTVAGEQALAVVQNLFAGMRAGDTAAVRRAFRPDARLTATRMDNGAFVTRTEEPAAFIGQLAGGSGRFDERIFEPRVAVDGTLADVSGYYEFYLDGKFGHCGVDAFHLVRTRQGWRILDIAYSVRTEGCRMLGKGQPAGRQ